MVKSSLVQPTTQSLRSHNISGSTSANVRGHMTCHSKHSEPLFELCRTDENNFSLLKVSFLNSSMQQRWISGPDAQVFKHNFDPCSLCWALALASLTFYELFFHFLIVESLLSLFLFTLFCLFLSVDNSKTYRATYMYLSITFKVFLEILSEDFKTKNSWRHSLFSSCAFFVLDLNA